MINQHHVQCDRCHETLTTPYMSFRVKLKKIKESGWQIMQMRGIWRHYCPDCKTKTKIKQKPEPKKEIEYWWQKY